MTCPWSGLRRSRSWRRDTLRLLTRTFARTARSHPRPVAALVFWSMIEAAPTLLFGLAVARAVDAFRADHPWNAGAWLGLLAVTALAGAVGSKRLYGPLAAIVEPFRDDLVRLVTRGALYRSLNGRPDTGAVARLTHQVEIVRDTFGGLLVVVRGFLFAAAGAAIGLLALMPQVALLVVAPLVLGLGLFTLAFGAAAARQRDLVVGEEEIAERTGALAEGLRDVVACGGEERVRERLAQVVDGQAAAGRAVARMTAVRVLTIAVGGWIPPLLILICAPWLVRHGATAGTVVGALTYVLHGLQPALQSLVQGMGGSGLRLAVTLGRILETAAAPPPPVRPFPDGRRAPVSGTAIELRDVTFAYGPHAQPVISDLDLSIPAGDHVAVVGPSGIGKSTLAALVAGVLSPDAGRVRVGGRPPGDPRLRVLIPQEAYVFTGTLHDNVAYLAPGATDDAVVGAGDAVGLTTLAARLGGYGGLVDPAALSAGERQLIALARAHLAPAPVIMLDEAGCHLDPAAEARAERALARRPGTLIVIAHRMSSALRARRVLVLDGTRARLGSHEELLRSSPLYRDLVGHWTGSGSQPPRLLGDADGVHPVARADLAVDAREVVADRSDREHQALGDLRGRESL
ncbi:ATP-binding cassette domain-containing protein [Actinomadura barringtoniae]|uniref:ATP-binding cassette domain-containing protein n=1 Tax=Actinomadura barringtoniae TaxID=1427535 RepID=UPI001FB5EE82|nr:ABC transporter ATP-binding protein [Actinomadura barringtoniae]